ncbi:MAG TPA: hypothetical protein VKG79_01110 [Bryobacteraceae bacterium]|nr:hypothetical protein [Bryobacteraceae bacterium]
MRSLVSIAALGLIASTGSVYAQALSEHAAAAAGATIGTAAGKPVANALGGILNSVDSTTTLAAQTGAKTKATAVAPKTGADPAASVNRAAAPGVFSPGFGADSAAAADVPASGAASRSRRRSAPAVAPATSPVILAPIPEPVKEPSLEEVAGVKIGTTEHDLFAALGKPESHVSVPDDDGHLRESCQYWANGKQLGTIRLDNGQVVKVEVRGRN